jgi:23S rRNA (cytidine1920-2'-O)/16S rRNA (cytidine1409-2'-O)-methyltransferase
MNAKKERIDKVLVDRGLTHSRERARALIMAGQVVVADHKAEKPGQMVPVNADVRIKGELMPFVGRGGLKLQKALDEFKIDVVGLVALDVGASTGGFTDCLLQRGAQKVFAVDVGYGQLAWKLRQDERVVSLEKTNIRHLTADRLPEVPDIAVIDASFISLVKVLPATLTLLKDGGVIIALIKPQFEVGPGEVGKGGVVRDAEKQKNVVSAISTAAENMGLLVRGVTESPILGAKGNREFLIVLEKATGNTGGKTEG